MGAQQSTRKLTLDNDDPTNVIKVSDAVVDRLKGNTEAKNRGASTSTATPVSQAVPTTIPAVGVPVSPIYPQYMYEPVPTSLQLRQDREVALQKNDAYWQNRINKLEETHEKINKLMEKEYNDAVQEVKDGLSAPPSVTRKPACQAGKKAVMECYKKHPHEPMRCAREVQAFAECVDKHRTELIANRG